jgi:hypothetical protein
VLTVENVKTRMHSYKNPVPPHSLTYGSAHITIDHPIGRAGKPMRVSIAIQDHARKWHGLTFPMLRWVGNVPE